MEAGAGEEANEHGAANAATTTTAAAGAGPSKAAASAAPPSVSCHMAAFLLSLRCPCITDAYWVTPALHACRATAHSNVRFELLTVFDYLVGAFPSVREIWLCGLFCIPVVLALILC